MLKLIALFFISTAQAEYRVFELVIQNTQTKAERIVISNLDPLQYPGYYDLSPTEIVMYRDTWMCWGDTSYQKAYCPKPTPRAPTESPAQRDLASQ